MCKIGTPKNLEGFLKAGSEFAIELQKDGLQAYYKDKDSVYFKIDEKLLAYIRGEK
jgi:hypothetical protein